MDGELVTGSLSGAATGGGESRSPVASRYGEKFEELCGYYMSLGMSYHDYWDGDAEMAKYYREMDEVRRERENTSLWLQGLYFYEALIDASPVINAFSKKKKPYPYRDTPIPLTAQANKRKKEQENMKKLENGKTAMRAMMAGINRKFQGKEGKGHGG